MIDDENLERSSCGFQPQAERLQDAEDRRAVRIGLRLRLLAGTQWSLYWWQAVAPRRQVDVESAGDAGAIDDHAIEKARESSDQAGDLAACES